MKNHTKSGYAMIVALVAVLVITLASLSIFTALSTAITDSAKEIDRQQAGILAESLMEVVTEQMDAVVMLEDGSLGYSVTSGMASADYAGSVPAYVYSHLGVDWAWVSDEESGHSADGNTRTFDLTAEELRPLGIGVSLAAFWTSSMAEETAGRMSGRELCFTVTVSYRGRSGTEEAQAVKWFRCQGIDEENDVFLWRSTTGER